MGECGDELYNGYTRPFFAHIDEYFDITRNVYVPSGRHFCPFCLFGGALWADYLTPDWFRSLFQISTAAILIPTSNLHDPPKIASRNRRPSVLNEKSDIEKNRNSFDN